MPHVAEPLTNFIVKPNTRRQLIKRARHPVRRTGDGMGLTEVCRSRPRRNMLYRMKFKGLKIGNSLSSTSSCDCVCLTCRQMPIPKSICAPFIPYVTQHSMFDSQPCRQVPERAHQSRNHDFSPIVRARARPMREFVTHGVVSHPDKDYPIVTFSREKNAEEG